MNLLVTKWRDQPGWMTVRWRGLDNEGCVIPRRLKMEVVILGDLAMGALAGEEGALAKAVSRDWREVSDDDGQPIAFSAGALDEIIRTEPQFAESFDSAYRLHRDRRFGRNKSARLRALLSRLRRRKR